MLKFCDVINCIFVHSPKKLTLGGATSQKTQKKCKNHDISIIIPPLGMAWVSKEAV
jgi:hypothetical protein